MGILIAQRMAGAAVVGTAAVVALVAASSGAATARSQDAAAQTMAAASGKIVLTVRLKSSRVGTFSVKGVVSDAGTAQGRATFTRKRLRLILALKGADGAMTAILKQGCSASRGTWKIVWGSHAYAGLIGSGVASGRFVCHRRASYRGVLTGSVRTPPPKQLAAPGLYRGTRTAASLRVAFVVQSDGRTVSDVSLRQIVARCDPARIDFLQPTFPGPYSIGADKKVTIISDGYEVTITFASGRAKGTVTYAANGCKSQPVSWRVKNPPDALPSVAHGRYCGFMLSGAGICLDVTDDALVTNVHMSAKVRCNDQKSFALDYTYDGVIAIRSDRGFLMNLSDVPLANGGSMRWRIGGAFDQTGGVKGTGGFGRITLVRNGTSYRCQSAMTGWSAKLGA